MRVAIIGYTGFVGGYLNSCNKFNDKFNSKNIQDICKNEYDSIICAGAPGTKWFANKFPEDDKKSIDLLINNLKNAETKKLILISTTDVYPTPSQVDESSTISFEKLTPYGANRRRLEQFVESKFSNSNIIRLPGLFGKGLKKNILFDLITNSNLDKLPALGRFQFYDITDLQKDIDFILEKEIRLINLVTEPISVQEIYKDIFKMKNIGKIIVSSPNYDVRTKHSNLFGGLNYILGKEGIKQKLKNFVRAEIQK